MYVDNFKLRRDIQNPVHLDPCPSFQKLSHVICILRWPHWAPCHFLNISFSQILLTYKLLLLAPSLSLLIFFYQYAPVAQYFRGSDSL